MNKRNTRKVLRVIESAITTLRSKKNWLQFDTAQDANGGYARPGDLKATRFDASGAVRHSARVLSHPSDPTGVTRSIEKAALYELRRGIEMTSHRREDLLSVNDYSRNAHARILRGLRVARNRLRNRLSA